MSEPLLFEKTVEDRSSASLPVFPEADARSGEAVPDRLRRVTDAGLPELSEMDVVRHYTRLSHTNYAVDLGFYPLGSCTMKYNPVMNEDGASLAGFTGLHPMQPVETVQGILRLLYQTLEALCEITGMDWGTLQPFAGAHGEFTGMKLFKGYFKSRGEENRRVVLVPDSAHGTNPASAHIAGFDVKVIPSNSDGMVDPSVVEQHLDDTLAGIMLTNPNTLGTFEHEIEAIAAMVHDAGGLLYYDGANLNAVMGKCKPGAMGFDVVHLNLHKTFSTPHGGGGPGAGPVLVRSHLIPFLPVPDIVHTPEGYRFVSDKPESVGRISGFWGNVGVIVRAYGYILRMGGNGLTAASEGAVLNANYLRTLIQRILPVPQKGLCKHEFVASAKDLRENQGISGIDVAKGLIDRGVHPPTVYFPLIVPEALMIETTETESKETLDHFAELISDIVDTAKTDPDSLKKAPVHTPVSRVDEVLAARKPRVRWTPESTQT